MWGQLHFGALILLLAAASDATAEAADPDQLLTRAEHLAEIGNLDAARPLYTQAEQEFHARGDTRKELYAKFGRLWRDVESGSYSSVAVEVAIDLQNPVVQNDAALKIRALSLKGVIDLNLNTGAAQDDFSQILALAKSIGDRKWENRATGELGIVAGVNGDERTAAAALLQAITTAAALNDVEAQITFNTWIANGMTVQGMADGAIQFLDRALGLIATEPDAGFPIQLYIARIRALVAIGGTSGASSMVEARRLVDSSLKYARENEVLGAQCELLISNLLGRLRTPSGLNSRLGQFCKALNRMGAGASVSWSRCDTWSYPRQSPPSCAWPAIAVGGSTLCYPYHR